MLMKRMMWQRNPTITQVMILQQQELKSIPWRLAEFYYNRDLQRPYTGTSTILQETINLFLCPFIIFLESITHQ